MRIEFDPTNRDEATAVRAVLAALSGEPIHFDEVHTRVIKVVPRQNSPIHRTDVQDADGNWGPAPEEGITETSVEETSEQVVPETDSTGTPWDDRIHSTPPTQNKDGTWRAKRGVTADVVAAVRAERTAPVGLIDNMTEEELSEDRSEENPNVGVPAQEQSAPPAPNAPVQAPTPPAPPSPTAAPSFLDVMKAITAAQKDGKIDTVKVKEMCAAVDAGDSTMGLNGPDNADKRSAFMALLQEVVG